MKIITCMILTVLSLGLPWLEFAVAASDYFPTTTGSTWTYATEALTLSGEEIVMKSGTETAQVLPDGRFRSFLSLENGNTTESYTSYADQDQALFVSGTVITIKTVDMPEGWAETTTNNSYSPYLLVFPSATGQGAHETSSSTQTTNLTGTFHYPPYEIPMSSTNTTSQHVIDITVGAVETVMVPAGTFSALRIETTDTVTEAGQTSTYTMSQWYASGVGLVKLTSPNLNRQLTSYSVSSGSTRQLTVTLQGTGGGSINSDPSGFICDSGVCSKSYAQGTGLTLYSFPDAESLFASWGGDCTGSGPCGVTMLADRAVTATFTAVPPVRMGGNDYSSIQAAFDVVAGDSFVKARSRTLTGDVTLGQPWTVRLEGGYDTSFAARTGRTILQGRLTVVMGKLVADKVYVK